MKLKKWSGRLLCGLLTACLLSVPAFGAKEQQDIIILYENDVHCAVEGYSKLAALKQELAQSGAHVGVVSAGDYIQGTSLGAASEGEYIVRLMNLVGYDAVALGNHEFDFQVARLEELVGMMETKPTCCNFRRVDQAESRFEPYTMVQYGQTKIAYVGITTPSTLVSAAPAQFKGEDGEFIYTFSPDELQQVVQAAVDGARGEGADYVVALSHLGDEDGLHNVQKLVAGIRGVDAVLDGHAHSVIPAATLLDAEGNEVLLSSTGTAFEYIGQLTISDGELHTQLIRTEEYAPTHPGLDGCIQQIHAEFEQIGTRKVADSRVTLRAYDEQGVRLVRTEQTNLGCFVADAYRHVMDADISYMQGGGLRTDLKEGEVSFNELMDVLPFNNYVVTARVTGRAVRDMLENAVMSWPEENGSFPHVSGMTFCVNTQTPSGVRLDGNESFVGVDGPYRVYDIRVLDKDTGEYAPLDLDGEYTLAAQDFILLGQGNGMAMLADAQMLDSEGVLDVMLLEQYITQQLGGVIQEPYVQPEERITFTQGKQSDGQEAVAGSALWLALPAAGCILAGAAVLAVRKRRS